MPVIKNMMLEEHEWENTFITTLSDTETKRVLYVGDSISQGTRGFLRNLCKDKFIVDGYASSKGLDHPSYFPMLKMVASQAPRCDVILFNNGLHGYHLDEDAYEQAYRVFVEKLQEQFPETKLILLLSTYTVDPKMFNDRVVERNRRVLKIAQEKGLFVIDQYTVSKENASLLSDDDVHFTGDGYKILAQSIYHFLQENM